LEGKLFRKNCSLIGLLFSVFVLVTQPVVAQPKPIQLSLFPPIQLVPEGNAISGIRLNLPYGRNTSVTGLDWGLVGHSTSGVSKGVQIGLVGLVDADFTGWQSNFANFTKGKFEGFQWGFVNYAGHASGFQLGFVNYAVSMKGLQIGLVNIIKQGGQFPIFPIVNWSF
jgi:hypothetical protein